MAAVVVRTKRTRSTYIGESFRDCRLGVREPKANTCIIPHHQYSNTPTPTPSRSSERTRALCFARTEVYRYQLVLLTTILTLCPSPRVFRSLSSSLSALCLSALSLSFPLEAQADIMRREADNLSFLIPAQERERETASEKQRRRWRP